MDLPASRVTEMIKGDDRSKWMSFSNHNIKGFTEDEMRRITSNYGTVLGKGSFGEVYKGVLQDGSLVAVKRFMSNVEENFAKELKVHCEINHKNVVRLIGYCAEENALMIVTEYISKGSLNDVLHHGGIHIPLDTRLRIAVECSEALCYMHSQMYTQVIHSDIKPANILLDENLNAKISDFGISRLVNTDATLFTEHVIGSICYMDPLFAKYGRLTPKSDVYSFGIVLLELITKKKTTARIGELGIVECFTQALGTGIRRVRELFDVEISSQNNMKVLEGVAKLAEECMRMELDRRPEMIDVVERLRALRKTQVQGKQRLTIFSWGWKKQPATQNNSQSSSLGHTRTSSKSINVKDYADATSENRTQSRKDDPAAAASAKTASEHEVESRRPSPDLLVAGWPAWLANVAPKAIEGWLPRRSDSFEKIDKIGQGTYSNVYKARDLITGKIVALKKVRFDSMDPRSLRFVAREIHILRRLDHPNIIKLEAIVTSRLSQSLCLVFEYMEHDLSDLIAAPDLKLTEPWIKCFVQQLLHGLDHCHNNGVLHRDIKGSNLLIDSNGTLKIADFGQAISYDPNNPQPLTSRVVTLWYRPPELLLCATEYGAAVDMWSTGCLIAELFAGKPIMPGGTEVEQLHKIFKLCGSPSDDYWKEIISKVPGLVVFKPQRQYRRRVAKTFKVFPPSAVVLIDSLLSFESEVRGTASSALGSDFFRTEPLACDPSSLPKLLPSKEYYVKLRQEEAKRQKNAALGGQGAESLKPGNENHVASHAVNDASKSKNHGRKLRSIHLSGPLVPSGESIDDITKEHDRRIREAVRMARLGSSQENMQQQKGPREL